MSVANVQGLACGEPKDEFTEVDWPVGVRVRVEVETGDRCKSSEFGGVLQMLHVKHAMGAIWVHKTEVGP